MLLQKEQSCFLLIDVQEKLTPLVRQSDNLVNNISKLLDLANSLRLPIAVSEQYPKGLGSTLTSLTALMGPEKAIEKVHFSSWREPTFKQHLSSLNKKQLLLTGIETHVCILQTAIDLVNADYEVFVVVDAVSSRQELDHRYGLKRMKQAGVELVTSEMVFFEWLEQAGTEDFKSLSKRFFNKN